MEQNHAILMIYDRIAKDREKAISQVQSLSGYNSPTDHSIAMPILALYRKKNAVPMVYDRYSLNDLVQLSSNINQI
jgi:hypothetical protein